MEPTTKKCKTEKLKSKKTDMLRSNSKRCGESMYRPIVSPEEEKEGCDEKDLQKRKVLILE